MKRTKRYFDRPSAGPRKSAQAQARPVMPPPQPEDLPELTLAVGKPIYGGNFLARHEGKAIFVPLALEGEEVRVRLIDNRKNFATAELVAVEQPSTERIQPRCPHFGRCGGCHYQHTSYAQQLAMKQAILTESLERAKVELPENIAILAAESEDEAWGYRSRIRVAFDREGRPGFRSEHSHRIIALEQCPISAPGLIKAMQSLATLAQQKKIRLREAALFTTAAEEALAITLLIERGPRVELDALAAELKSELPTLTGMELALAPMSRHELPRTLARWGNSSLFYPVAGTSYRVDHGAFFQINRWLVDAMVDEVVGEAEGKRAWDLYAGVGLFARALAKHYKKVVAVESSPLSTGALADNLEECKAKAVAEDTLRFLRTQQADDAPDRIVADPPRTGLGAEVCGELLRLKAPLLTAVSCDPATLARDLKLLTEGGYRITALTLLDLFPQTYHMEAVVQLAL